MSAGRFAPSPTGDLHLGNLRTALLAWLFARSSGRDFLIRIDDLDRGRSRPEFERQQLEDLTALGLTSDGPVMRQSERTARYDEVLTELVTAGRTFECFCTRREIAEAASAPHALPGAYPGACRDLSTSERDRRRRERPPAIRLRAEVTHWTITDELCGLASSEVDDFVLRRNDGVHAYNLAVVVDDHDQNVDQVVRGDDLLSSAGRQAYLAHLLGLAEVSYAHVPLALNSEGRRLAKRDGPVTLRDLSASTAWRLIVDSLGLAGDTPDELLPGFAPANLPRSPWVVEMANASGAPGLGSAGTVG